MRQSFCYIHRAKNPVTKGFGSERWRGSEKYHMGWVATCIWVKLKTTSNLRTKLLLIQPGAKIHHCQPTELLVLPKPDSSLLEFINLWIDVPHYHNAVLTLRKQLKGTASTLLFKQNNFRIKITSKFCSDGQVFRCSLHTQMSIQQCSLYFSYMQFCVMVDISIYICWTCSIYFNKHYLH